MNDYYVVPSLDLVVVRKGNDNPPREKRSLFREDGAGEDRAGGSTGVLMTHSSCGARGVSVL